MTNNNYNWKILDGSKKTDTNYPKWLLDVLENRGIKNFDEFMTSSYENLEDPESFLNIKEAVERVIRAKDNEEKIVVYGDYDVDGICATSLVFELLHKIGVQNIETYIPHREDEGYGLNKEALEKLKKEGANLIITVDCGVTSGDLIDAEKDIDFIVIDHHEINEKKLPKKAIILHPEMVKNNKEKHSISGCGMAFFFALSLKNEYPEGWEKWLLDLVALATVCDIVPLIGQNRILVKWGLLVLSKTKRVGLLELMKVSSIDPRDISAYTLGFILGPSLNASGRLDHAKKSLELVLSKKQSEAREISNYLNKINAERQKLCNEIAAEAKAEIEGSELKNKTVLLLSNKKWPRGVVGIIASRITEAYHRPTIIFEENDGELHGSARSIDGFNITEALRKLSELLIKYGGHTKAAGVSLKVDNLSELDKKLNQIANKIIKKEDLQKTIYIDSVIKESEVNEEMMEWLKKLEPFGYGNQAPFFLMKNAVVSNIKRVGGEKEHLKFLVGEKEISSISFRDNRKLEEGKKYNLVFQVKYNEWNGRKNIEYNIKDLKESNA